MARWRKGTVIRRVRPRPVRGTGQWRGAGVSVDLSGDAGMWLASSVLQPEHPSGFRGRAEATLTVLEDPWGARVVLVSAPLFSGSRYLTERVAASLDPRDGIGIDALVLMASRSRGAPAHLHGDVDGDAHPPLVEGQTPESWLDATLADALAERLVHGIRLALGALRPVRVSWHRHLLFGYSANRSMAAFPGARETDAEGARAWMEQALTPEERAQVPGGWSALRYAVDPRLQVLVVCDAGTQKVVSAHAFWAADACTLAPGRGLAGPDVTGEACMRARVLALDAGVAEPGTALGWSWTTGADVMAVSPQTDPAQFAEVVGEDREGRVSRQLAEPLAQALLACLQAAARGEGQGLSSPSDRLVVRFTEPLLDRKACAEQRLTWPPVQGRLAWLGTEFDRFFVARQVARTTWARQAQRLVLDGRRAWELGDPEPASRVHGSDVDALRPMDGAGWGALPGAQVVPLRVIDVGPLRLGAVPFAVTTSLGRVLEDALTLGRRPACVACTAGGDVGAATLGSEYDAQHAEGAAVRWGRNTGAWLVSALAATAAQVPGAAHVRREARFSSPRRERRIDDAAWWFGPAQDVVARWTGSGLELQWRPSRAVKPAFGPEPWCQLLHRPGLGAWVPVEWQGVALHEGLGECTVEHLPWWFVSHRWVVRWRLPAPVLAGLPEEGVYGVRVTPSAFAWPGVVQVQGRPPVPKK